MDRLRSSCIAIAIAGLCPLRATAAPIGVDFEGLADGIAVTTQYPGLVFSGATVLVAGISLNELEFPPKSGTNAGFDDGGPILITADAPMAEFSGYFNYATQLLLEAFDDAGQRVAVAGSAFASNLALSGDAGSSPNEWLRLAHGTGFRSILITGDALGASFTLDDLSVRRVPEPATLALVLLVAGAAGTAGARRRWPRNAAGIVTGRVDPAPKTR